MAQCGVVCVCGVNCPIFQPCGINIRICHMYIIMVCNSCPVGELLRSKFIHLTLKLCLN